MGIIRFLLDTNTISEPLKAKANADVLLRLEQHHTEFAIAAVVWHELWFGCHLLPFSQKRTTIAAYLNELLNDAIPILPYDIQAADWHAAQRSRLVSLGQTPSFNDGQIAAIAAVNGLILVTRNIGDYTRYHGLTIQNWFEPYSLPQ